MVRIADDGSKVLESSSEMNRRDESFADPNNESNFKETKICH